MKTPSSHCSSSSEAARAKGKQVEHTDPDSFLCLECNKTFPTGHALGSHRKFHRDLDPNLRMERRRRKRILLENGGHPTQLPISHPMPEIVPWPLFDARYTVDTRVGDRGMVEGSKAVQFIDFMLVQDSKPGVVQTDVGLALDLGCLDDPNPVEMELEADLPDAMLVDHDLEAPTERADEAIDMDLDLTLHL